MLAAGSQLRLGCMWLAAQLHGYFFFAAAAWALPAGVTARNMPAGLNMLHGISFFPNVLDCVAVG